MDSGKQWFHRETNGLHIFLESLTGDKLWIGYLIVAFICVFERGISFSMDHYTFQKRATAIVMRTCMYGVATSLRLLYMLAVMYFNIGLFLVVVFSLTITQFFIEMIKYYHNNKTNPLNQYQGYKSIHKPDSEEEECSFQHQYNIPKIIISRSSSSEKPEI